ncbi:MAG: flavodoxin family protein [Oscillospiraceae bacterium]|nr:flavodoxin family protein [Oscillospiraceae bacterium]
MSKNVLIISSSLRNHSNSEALAQKFMQGALDAGHKAEIISLKGKKIGFCTGCLACSNTQKCVIRDDSTYITEKMLNADVIAFATPVYYYGMSGQLKVLLDRANPLYSSDYKFRDICLLACAAEDEKTTVDGTVTGIMGWIDCFSKVELKGTVFAGGVNDAGDIKGHNALEKAYALGQQL